ncbi:chemotaxis response regulator protein-glutamate methylesterase [Erythrobacter sp. SCSIO 43205]|uniref:protein-glutamate methylesterase/protein-glutamine glutaminase n=1 Tax=Erythrobacter sp. SCSIO 43205 TaxID=2779361 RepID=UPI001CA7F9B8|nr:chemotaxis response regulator protein-glutamate methylesterase [Erythrobacter sp. SCSIO 43205]UAB79552.1 chemotaxis response regulator protein-glutamate methylesterase [Erythrobacter sp. SCSIO 43205]
MTVRVLVVDDSAMMRALISRKLNAESDIEVIATANDAIEARQLIKQLDPDVVTLDIEMPGMDGLSFLEKIMTLRPTPVIVVSGSTRAGTQATARALQLGAVNCYAKSTRERSIKDDDGGELARLVREASKVELARTVSPNRPNAATRPRARTAAGNAVSTRPAITASARGNRQRPDLIAIGSSTGGVEALNKLLRDFPADCPPTLIVQHVNATFAPAIAQSLDKIAAPRVALAESDTILAPGLVLVAPGDTKHLEVARAGRHGYRAVLREGELTSGHRPSVDRLFASVAKTVGERAVGVILTGMGEDGARELASMAQTGAHTIAQDRESCVVFGMPRAAIALGAAKAVLPLERITREIFDFVPTAQSHESSARLSMSAHESLRGQQQAQTRAGLRSGTTWETNL